MFKQTIEYVSRQAWKYLQEKENYSRFEKEPGFLKTKI